MRERFAQSAGPEIRAVGLFAGASELAADMPAPPLPCPPFGRALRRENFDTMLLARARNRRSSLDSDSAAWLEQLRSDGPIREKAITRLHELLLRAARFEVARRRAVLPHVDWARMHIRDHPA